MEEQNFPLYLRGLCEAMQHEKLSPEARMLAGIQVKNTIVAKSESVRIRLENRWLMLQPQVRNHVKLQLLKTLNNENRKIREITAAVVSKVAAVEIPKRCWPGLVPQLVEAIGGQKTHENLKEACFTTLGLVCEECPSHLQQHSTKILNAIASGMHNDQKNGNIKLEATRALANSLKMVKKNFSVQKERNLIMTMIFSAATTNNENVRLAAFMCLEEVAKSYYSYIGSYMKKVYELTSHAIKTEGESDIAKQAIEFWSTVSEEEIEIEDEKLEAEEKGRKPDRQNFGFVKTAAKPLSELLLHCLTKQDEDIDSDEWNVAQSGACCLMLMAQNIQNNVVPLVLPFIKNKIKDKHWRMREAATMAFSCILDGPDKNELQKLVVQAFPVILGHLQDPQPQVKDTAAWTVGKICSELPATITPEILPNLMNALRKGLEEPPKIAVHICWAIHELANEVQIEDGKTSALSKYFMGMVQELLKTTARSDADQNLQHDAFEAINALIHNAAPDTYNVIAKLVPELLGRLQRTLNQAKQASSNSEANRVSNAQAHLCAALGYAIVKNPQNCMQYMDPMMEFFLQVLRMPKSEAHEEALIAISAVARCTGQGFIKYMGALRPFVMRHLKDTQNHKACGLATGLVGDISRAIEGKITQDPSFCNELVEQLMHNLQNQHLDRSVKPRIINCLGDIALAIGGHFEKYLQWVMKLMEDAASVDFRDHRDEDDIDYLNLLRESVLEAYLAILQGLSDDGKEGLFLSKKYMHKLVEFLIRIAKDSDVDQIVTRAACSLIGDLARILGGQADVKKFLLSHEVIKKIIHDGDNGDEESKRGAEYAKKELHSLQGN